jgi:hypothetical protein
LFIENKIIFHHLPNTENDLDQASLKVLLGSIMGIFGSNQSECCAGSIMGIFGSGLPEGSVR